MKKILCLAIVIMLVLFCAGCGATMQTTEDIKDEPTNVSMFVLIEQGDSYKIVYHKETKVMYAISTGYYNQGNFTIMLDADGKPLLWEG